MTAANCGKISFLLPLLAMLVQNVLPSPITQLAAIDPFDNNVSEDLNEITLALMGINKIREANGVSGNVTAAEDLTVWAGLVSKHLCDLLVEQGDKFTVPTKDDPSIPFFDKIFDYKEEEFPVTNTTDQTDNNTTDNAVSTTPKKGVTTISLPNFVVETIRKWYKKTQDEVKNGVKKESISIFDPDTKYLGLGITGKMGEVKNEKVKVFFTCLLNFATQAQVDNFHKVAEEKKDTVTK